MNSLRMFLFMIGVVVAFIGSISIIVNLIKRRALKKNGITILVGVISMIIGLFIIPDGSTSDEGINKISKEPILEEQQSNTKTVENKDKVEEEEQEIKSKLEAFNTKIKEDSVQADFVEINGNEDADGMKVYAKGEIGVVDYDNVMDVMPSFLLSQEEGDGFGVYHIVNEFNYEGLEDGDIVTIYGIVMGTTETGIPKIIATKIESE